MSELGDIKQQKLGNMILEGHLGGFFDEGDGGTYYPNMWSYLINKYQIKNILDIGCGRGYSSLYFQSLGCNTIGIDGSINAQKLSLIPNNFILHDYSTGPSPLKESFDLGWSCEFVEHIEEKYIPNFIKDFKKCKYICMTYAGLGQSGHHHVNCNTEDYWIKTLQNNNFAFLKDDTATLRDEAIKDKELQDNERFHFHFLNRGLLFSNTELN